MKLPRMGLRSVALLAVAGAALTGAAWGGYALLTNGSATRVVPAPEAKPKTTHPPIAALREHMLHEFHGAANNVFTSIPGFGWERMRPMYKKIPFEIPYFSTAELEIETGPKEIPAVIKPFLDTSFSAFNNPAPIKSVIAKDPEMQFGPKEGGLGSNFRGAIAYGMQLRMLDLVGLMDKDDPKVYSGGQAFELVRMSHDDIRKAQEEALKRIAADPLKVNEINPLPESSDYTEPVKSTPNLATRPLDSFEVAGALALTEGQDVFIRSKDHVTRMLGALRASDQCLKCHTEAKKGDLLGAFSYTFVDSAKVKRNDLGSDPKSRLDHLIVPEDNQDILAHDEVIMNEPMPTTDLGINDHEIIERLKKENEELRKERHALLLALFPPQPDSCFHAEDNRVYSWDEFRAAITQD